MELLGAVLFAVGGVICHQKPERSFFLDGHQFPVCARCTGLYLSAGAGVMGWFGLKLLRRSTSIRLEARSVIRMLLLAGVPTALSLASGAIGLWDGSNLTRALISIPLGASAGAIVAAVATKDLR
jgi:uncharacterized membrane protein